MAKAGPRKKVPKELAVINADNCTGCESCLEVCPVDCIELKTIDRGIVKGTQQWCEIDLERCVGCEVCVHIPGKKSNPYELKVCPWDAIEMVPTELVATFVAQVGGPPEYIQEHWDRLVGTAQHLAELRAGAESRASLNSELDKVMNKKVLAGWILSGLIAAVLILLSARGKFFDFPDKDEMFAKMGWGKEVMVKIGVVEVAIAILFLIPRTAFLAAVLLTGYLGGAVATHVRMNDQFVFPIIIGVLAWIALGLRDGRVFAAAFGPAQRDSTV